MGGFCVFGISMTACRKKAERITPTEIPNSGRKSYSAPEWGAIVRAKAAELFESEIKRERISPELDSPQFCADWIASQPGQTRQTVVMYRGQKIDKHGGVVMRNGAPVMTWIEFDPAKMPPPPFGKMP